MKMVQRNKLSIQPTTTTNTLGSGTNKSHFTTCTANPRALQNCDVKIRRKMKKSQSIIKRTDINFTPKTHPPPAAPALLTPTTTPSSKKPLSSNKTTTHDLQVSLKTCHVFQQPGLGEQTPQKKLLLSGNSTSFYGSPNYMKATTSSEARKEEIHWVGKTQGKSSSSSSSSPLRKVRTLLTTKPPSFKHTRTGGGGIHNKNNRLSCKETSLQLEAQRATCSSTLKDSKFPSYLRLAPGATEAEGTSAMRVCPYTYCSLNGHHHTHTPAPPLKSFLISSRRRMSKTLKNVNREPNVFPGKRKRAGIMVTEAEEEDDDDDSKIGFVLIPDDQKDDCFVEIHVPVPRHDSEVISETDFQGDTDMLSEIMDEECPLSTLDQNQATVFECYEQGMDSDASVSLDQGFGEISDMEWEEGENMETHDEKVVQVPNDNKGRHEEDEEREAGFELEMFLAEKLLPYIHDEIIECLFFSDADTASDSEASLTEEELDDETICAPELGEESVEEHAGDLEAASNEELIDSFYEPTESDKDLLYMGEETKDGVVMDENEENIGVEEQNPVAHNGSLAEVEQSEARNNDNATLSISTDSQQQPEEQNEPEAKKTTSSSSTNFDIKQNLKVELLQSFENHVVQVSDSAVETEDINLTEEEAAAIPAIISQKGHMEISGSKGNHSTDELLDFVCIKPKKTARCKKVDGEENEESREFNPRPPNFLAVEAEEDAEKVDLRHQDMDERRNAEDWMLDHALQKTVNQLAIARKRKVALLVEAFESVLPIPKYEPKTRRDSSGFSHARPIQACR